MSRPLSLLQKIFGKRLDSDRTMLDRSERVRLTPLHRIHFFTAEGKRVEIANISIGGMAVIYKSEYDWTEGDELRGKIDINGKSFPLDIQVRYLNNAKFCGCQFLTYDHLMRAAIEDYLRGEIQGMKLKRVSEAYMKADPRGNVIWFTDSRENEIYCVHDSKGLIAFHMSFLGNYLEGDLVRGVRAGYVREHELKAQPGHKGASLLEMNSNTPEETRLLARAIIQNVEDMPPDSRQQLLHLLFRVR